MADRWRTAVLQKDANEIAKTALPEHRESVIEALSDSTSELHMTLYGKRIQGILAEPEVETLLIREKVIAGFRVGTRVCFVVPEEKKPSWPLSGEGMAAFSREEEVFCITASRTDAKGEEGWYFSYLFMYPYEGEE